MLQAYVGWTTIEADASIRAPPAVADSRVAKQTSSQHVDLMPANNTCPTSSPHMALSSVTGCWALPCDQRVLQHQQAVCAPWLALEQPHQTPHCCWMSGTQAVLSAAHLLLPPGCPAAARLPGVAAWNGAGTGLAMRTDLRGCNPSSVAAYVAPLICVQLQCLAAGINRQAHQLPTGACSCAL